MLHQLSKQKQVKARQSEEEKIRDTLREERGDMEIEKKTGKGGSNL
jgi:hypothetical protein